MRGFARGHDDLAQDYRLRRDTVLVSLAESLKEYIAGLMDREPRIDHIAARAKGVERFLEKAAAVGDDGLKYSEPLAQIQDQLGARIVVYYKCDVDRVVRKVERYFRPIENRELVPESESEFGYFGHHLVLATPTDIVDEDMEPSMVPAFFELQIKTLFQHAWSEADHDLGYKPGAGVLTSDEKRMIALSSAQAWGADRIFDELFRSRGGAPGAAPSGRRWRCDHDW